MRKKPPVLSYETYETQEPIHRPLAAWYHVAVTAILTFAAGAILVYYLAGFLFRF